MDMAGWRRGAPAFRSQPDLEYSASLAVLRVNSQHPRERQRRGSYPGAVPAPASFADAAGLRVRVAERPGMAAVFQYRQALPGGWVDLPDSSQHVHDAAWEELLLYAGVSGGVGGRCGGT